MFKMDDAVPMIAQPLAPDGLTLEGGFAWRHGCYEKKNLGLDAVRAFQPPCTIKQVVMMQLPGFKNALTSGQPLVLTVISPITEPSPNSIIIRTNYSFGGQDTLTYVIFVVPVGPGECRTFFKLAAGKAADKSDNSKSSSPSPLLNFVRSVSGGLPGLPHYLLPSQAPLVDEDSVMLHQQVDDKVAVTVRCFVQFTLPFEFLSRDIL